jgi:hypothetical protein
MTQTMMSNNTMKKIQIAKIMRNIDDIDNFCIYIEREIF